MRHLFIFLVLFLGNIFANNAQENVSVTINTSGRTASMSNGIVSININSKGHVNQMLHNGQDVIESDKGGRFYFSYNDQDSYRELSPNLVRIEKQTDDYAEVVYSNTTGSLRIEQGFIMRKGVSGIYSYIILKGTAREIKLREMRVVYRVSPTQFTYGYVTDRMQGELPSVEVMKEVNDQSIMDATYPLPDGTIYTKYDWANYIAQDSVHGIMSDSKGVWAIPVSAEYINGGPMRQELTVHTTNKTPLVLQMLQGEHFGAAAQYFSTGVDKMYGPFFIYVNEGDSHNEMIQDAQSQATVQKNQWPFEWLDNDLYPTERTEVKGKIALPFGLSPNNLQVVLAKPGDDIYDQGKDYIFWSKTHADGNFTIPHVRAGEYSLYAYASEGEITDEFEMENVSISGNSLDLGIIDWIPNKYEALIMELGTPNRLSDGYQYSDSLRKYGLYEFPPATVVYSIENSILSEKWYYAQTQDGRWAIRFENDKEWSGKAHLTISVAGAANGPKVVATVNNSTVGEMYFSNDASIYRSAILSGKHSLHTFEFDASKLRIGTNMVVLNASSVGNRGGVMYDYIKLEAGDKRIPNDNGVKDISTSVAVQSYPNPFNEHVTFQVQSITSKNAVLSVYSLQGQLIERIYSGEILGKNNEIIWNTSSVPAGTYVYQLKTENKTISGKIQKP